jgi:hypothetical protein
MTFKLVSAYEVPSKNGEKYGFSLLFKNKEDRSLVITETFKRNASSDKVIEQLTDMIKTIKDNATK